MSAPRYVDPMLLAVSDLLVLTALERSWSRVVPRSQRQAVRATQRHRGYESVPIHHERIDKALEGAWDLCSLLVARHDLDVEPGPWMEVLDSYARALLMACAAHSPARLRPHLAPLCGAVELSRPYVAVG